MYEQDFRKSLTKEELENRAFIIPFKVYDFDLLQRLDKYSMEFEQEWDVLINTAIIKLLDDIDTVRSLRKKVKASDIPSDMKSI
jgi:hypothetical protein